MDAGDLLAAWGDLVATKKRPGRGAGEENWLDNEAEKEPGGFFGFGGGVAADGV